MVDIVKNWQNSFNDTFPQDVRRRRVYFLYFSENEIDNNKYYYSNNNSNHYEIDDKKNLIEVFPKGTKKYNFDVSQDFGFKIDFNIHRSIYGGMGTMTLKIYNLPRQDREMLAQDYTSHLMLNSKRNVYLFAGYEGLNISCIFSGKTFQISSYRNGVDIITEVFAQDGEWNVNDDLNKIKININKENISRKVLIEDLANKLTQTDGISIGKLEVNDDTVRKVQIKDNKILNAIKKYIVDNQGNREDFQIFIDNQLLYILKKTTNLENVSFNEVVSSDVILDTPRRYGNNIILRTLFLPYLKLGQKLQINSSVTTQYNGQAFKVITIDQVGSICDTGDSNVTTKIELLSGVSSFKTEAQKAIEQLKGVLNK